MASSYGNQHSLIRDAVGADALDDDTVKARLLKHRTRQGRIREREADLLEELENEPTMPDAATHRRGGNRLTGSRL